MTTPSKSTNSASTTNREQQNQVGANGVAVPKHSYADDGYRTFEVYQRERVGESTELINGIDLVASTFADDPYPALEILRENYPCYRDWVNNCYWVTRYDDVTSILADDANFETRTTRWFYGLTDFGRDLNHELPVLEAWANTLQQQAHTTANRLCEQLSPTGANLALDFAAQFSSQLLAQVVGIPETNRDQFALLHWRAQRGVGWHPNAQQDGLNAIHELVQMFEQLMGNPALTPNDSTLINAVITLGGTPTDLVATLLESDHQTLHGGIANLWFLLLSHPQEFEKVKADRRLLKIAYLEALRHSTPVVCAQRFSKHEVERFGRLIPDGALMMCAAAAGNRDPRQFDEPDRFIADRRDICHREARGQYRADGLATGITAGLGAPTRHPAVPEDRPVSRYALVRDTVVVASTVILDRCQNLRLQASAAPVLRSLSVGEMHSCWSLPVEFDT